MNTKNITILIVILISLISCEKEIPLKQDEVKPRIVINSAFTADSACFIQLSASGSVLENENELPNIDNATAELFDANQNLLGEFTHINGGYYYLPSFLPTAGQSYSLEVNAPEFETATSTTYIPEPIQIIQVDTTTAIPDNQIQFNITFKDNVNKKNYYGLSIIRHTEVYDSLSGINYILDNKYFYTNEVYVENGTNDFGSEKYDQIFLFNDESFNGQTVNFEATHNLANENQIFTVILTNLSEDLYKYKSSYIEYWNTQDNFFAQPVQVYSNVENGFGIFAGYTESRDSIFVQ